MSSQWQIFVEGPDDRAFLKGLLQHLNIANVNTSIIGGGVAKLPNIANEIQRAYDAGKRIAIVLDANSDFTSRCAEFATQKASLKLPIDRFFLLPNNKDSGSLETLLEAMAISTHRVVYDCFDQYETCLQNRNTPYKLPNHKARIYAYCEALGLETRASKRQYVNSSYWNLNAPDLEPLKTFLRAL